MLNDSSNIFLELATIESDISFLNFGLLALKEKFKLKLFSSSLILKYLYNIIRKKIEYILIRINNIDFNHFSL